VALALAEDAVKLAPGHLFKEWALGDAAATAAKKVEARAAYDAAIAPPISLSGSGVQKMRLNSRQR
jgi:predicted negative regulator of RcsB-dependent stress response